MFVMEKDDIRTCPVCCLVYVVLPDASKAILNGKRKQRKSAGEMQYVAWLQALQPTRSVDFWK